MIGMRFADYTDSTQISNLYINEYGYEYVDPVVYNKSKLFVKLWDKRNNIWMVGENLINGEIAAVSLLELNKEIVYSGKTIINPQYRGFNIGSVLSFNCLKKIKKLGLIDDYIKIDSSVRNSLGALRLTESASGIAYGFVPDYHLFGDKRNHPRDPRNPFNEGYSEGAFLYFAALPKMRTCREEVVHLLDDELLFFLYYFIRNFRQATKIVMKNDRVIMSKGARIKEKKIPQLEVIPDPLNSIVTIFGTSGISYMEKICKLYKNYRIIIWKIPTTIEGINSMKYAFKLEFKAIGYDVASLKSNNSELFNDCIIFAYYNKKINDNFDDIKTTSKNKELFEKIIAQFN